MTRPGSIRSFVLLCTAVLLAGQGAALHHHHRRAADCPAGLCLEHGDHAEPAASVTSDDACPLCELAGQGRSVAPVHLGEHRPEPLRRAVAAPTAPDRHRPPGLAGPAARAPPSPA